MLVQTLVGRPAKSTARDCISGSCSPKFLTGVLHKPLHKPLHVLACLLACLASLAVVGVGTGPWVCHGRSGDVRMRLSETRLACFSGRRQAGSGTR